MPKTKKDASAKKPEQANRRFAAQQTERLLMQRKTKAPKTDFDIAYDFALLVYKKFDKVIKSIALFGSTAKGTAQPTSDIDIIIIVDDCTVQWDQELIAWYRTELQKLLIAEKYAKNIHVNTVTMSVFWHEINMGDPVAVNIIRYGQALIDFGGFFEPLKVLLAKGKIKPTPEAVYTTLRRAPIHLSRSRYSILSAVEGLYWATVDAAHAALMAAGETPPSPEHIPELLKANKKFRVDDKYIEWYKEIYKIAHSVTHGNITSIAGNEIDDLDVKANKFVQKMTEITKELLEGKKIIDIIFKKR